MSHRDAAAADGVHAVVLDCETIPFVDVTAARMLGEVTADLQRTGVRLVIARDIGQVRDVFAVAEGPGGPGEYFRTVQEAVDVTQTHPGLATPGANLAAQRQPASAHRRGTLAAGGGPLDHTHQATDHHVPAGEQRDGGRDLPLVAGDPVLEPLDRRFGAQRPEQVKRERDDHDVVLADRAGARMKAIKPARGFTLAVPAAVPSSAGGAVAEAAVRAAGLLVAGFAELHAVRVISTQMAPSAAIIARTAGPA